MSALSAACLLLHALCAGGAAPLELWEEDALVKVFHDAAPPGAAAFPVEAARGEQATIQVVIRAGEPLTGLRVEMTPLTAGQGAPITARPPRFVGYVHVDRPTQTPSPHQLRKPPADYPDVLWEQPPAGLPAGTALPVWFTVDVPADAAPGVYHATVRVDARTGAAGVQAALPVALEVFPVTVGRARLWVTNWFTMGNPRMKTPPKQGSEEFHALLRRYARNMAEHRQNVALISPLSLAKITSDGKGGLSADFSEFDRWVEIFQEEGVIGLIEGGHIGGREGGWDSNFVASVRTVDDAGGVRSLSVPPGGAEADAFYAWYFPALMAHLREKGWTDKYVQHLADEPTKSNLDSYRALAALARRHAPGLRIIEACHTRDLAGSMDVWVPQLNYLHQDFAHYQERQRAGEEVWFYTCVFPQGRYANRFIEQPLMLTRLLHWLNFYSGTTGYLHWGYNFWTEDDPVTHTTRPHGGPPYLPAGDPWIVYPAEDGGPVDSIRFEAMRDGVADHELLSMLAEKDPAAAREITARMIRGFDEYSVDAAQFRAARRALLGAFGGG